MSYALCKHLDRDPVTPLFRSLLEPRIPFFVLLQRFGGITPPTLLLFNGRLGVFFSFVLVRAEMFTADLLGSGHG
jgi:hypothetical protein